MKRIALILALSTFSCTSHQPKPKLHNEQSFELLNRAERYQRIKSITSEILRGAITQTEGIRLLKQAVGDEYWKVSWAALRGLVKLTKQNLFSSRELFDIFSSVLKKRRDWLKLVVIKQSYIVYSEGLFTNEDLTKLMNLAIAHGSADVKRKAYAILDGL